MSKSVFFVASAVKDGQLISHTIEAESISETTDIFNKKHNIKPEIVYGPFCKKKVIVKKEALKFTNKTKKAIYNDWIVNAFILEKPKDCAYLIFIKRVDGQKADKPKNKTINITELQEINV